MWGFPKGVLHEQPHLQHGDEERASFDSSWCVRTETCLKQIADTLPCRLTAEKRWTHLAAPTLQDIHTDPGSVSVTTPLRVPHSSPSVRLSAGYSRTLCACASSKTSQSQRFSTWYKYCIWSSLSTLTQYYFCTTSFIKHWYCTFYIKYMYEKSQARFDSNLKYLSK